METTIAMTDTDQPMVMMTVMMRHGHQPRQSRRRSSQPLDATTTMMTMTDTTVTVDLTDTTAEIIMEAGTRTRATACVATQAARCSVVWPLHQNRIILVW